MSKRSELVNTKKAGGSDLVHPRAVNSNGKVILTVYLSVCMCECVRACMACCLPFCHPGGGGGGDEVTLSLFINLSECHHHLGSVSVSVCLSVFQP